jgi:hypothetical protein
MRSAPASKAIYVVAWGTNGYTLAVRYIVAGVHKSSLSVGLAVRFFSFPWGTRRNELFCGRLTGSGTYR